MVAAFHTIAGDELQRPWARRSRATCSCAATTPRRRRWWARSCEDIPDLRWVDCGALSMARIAETHDRAARLGEPHVQGARTRRSASSGATRGAIRARERRRRARPHRRHEPVRGRAGDRLPRDRAPRRARAWTITSSPTIWIRSTDEFRLLLVDQRANGRSERSPESTWTLERMAQDVIMLARAMASGPLRGARALVRSVRRVAERRRLPRHGGADDRERRRPVHEVPRGRSRKPQRVRAGRLCASR